MRPIELEAASTNSQNDGLNGLAHGIGKLGRLVLILKVH